MSPPSRVAASVAGLLTLVLAVALVACGAATDNRTGQPTVEASAPSIAAATTSPDPSPTDADGDGDPSEGEETSVFDLEVGDCFDATGDEVQTVTVVDCAEPHVYEAFAAFEHEAGDDAPYPGDDALLQYADSECQPHFEDYVGTDYESSIYWITSVTPSEGTWHDGDREIVCTLKLGQAGEDTTGSAEGSGR